MPAKRTARRGAPKAKPASKRTTKREKKPVLPAWSVKALGVDPTDAPVMCEQALDVVMSGQPTGDSYLDEKPVIDRPGSDIGGDCLEEFLRQWEEIGSMALAPTNAETVAPHANVNFEAAWGEVEPVLRSFTAADARLAAASWLSALAAPVSMLVLSRILCAFEAELAKREALLAQHSVLLDKLQRGTTPRERAKLEKQFTAIERKLWPDPDSKLKASASDKFMDRQSDTAAYFERVKSAYARWRERRYGAAAAAASFNPNTSATTED